MLEINRKLVSREVRELLFSVIKRELNSRHHNILHCFEAFKKRVDLMTF